jgi:nitrous oxidase accessory protein NosD
VGNNLRPATTVIAQRVQAHATRNAIVIVSATSDVRSVQEAIGKVAEGGIIIVEDGNERESVVVNKKVTIAALKTYELAWSTRGNVVEIIGTSGMDVTLHASSAIVNVAQVMGGNACVFEECSCRSSVSAD